MVRPGWFARSVCYIAVYKLVSASNLSQHLAFTLSDYALHEVFVIGCRSIDHPS